MFELSDLLARLDHHAPRRAMLEAYYTGSQPLAFLAPEARDALGARFGRMASNIPRLAVTALAERLRITGFRIDGRLAQGLWADWLRCDLDQLAAIAHREALTLGSAYVIVWADAEGLPLVTIESAHHVAVETDPATGTVVAAVKRWSDSTGTNAILYTAETISRFRASATNAVAGFKLLETLPNPIGVVPVVRLRNSDRLLGPSASEIDDLIPLVDALNKTLADMLVSSEYVGRPRRWATGIELVEADVLDEHGTPTGETTTTNPFPEANRMMVAEGAEAKFGQLAAADLAGYESAVRVIEGQIAAVSALPAHYLGILGDQPPSADSLRAAEASLTARAEARQATFGRAWEQVAELMVAVRTGLELGTFKASIEWADAATRSIAQEADAVVKLFAAGLLPASYALKRLGYPADEVEAIRAAARAEALDRAGTDLAALLP